MSCKRRFYGLAAVAAIACLLIVSAYAWVPKVVSNDPLVRMPGTQPAQAISLETANRCLNCHADYVAGSEIEPGDGWKGSMMAQAARDPIFWACLTVAAQDSIWALGNPNAVDLCERCHFPAGWLGGRSDPANASAMIGDDYDGLSCDFCHRMYDPFYETTYNGTREGSDWLNYWNEKTTLSQVAGALVAHGVGFVLLASEARRSCAPAVGGTWRLGTVDVTALAALAAVELQLPTTTPLPWAILSASVLAGAYGLVAWALRLVTPQDLSPIVALWQSRGGLAKSRAATD